MNINQKPKLKNRERNENMTGINYYIKFFHDGVASQWLNGYGIGWYKTWYRGFGMFKGHNPVAVKFKNGKTIPVVDWYVGIWWIYNVRIIRIPTKQEWNGY